MKFASRYLSLAAAALATSAGPAVASTTRKISEGDKKAPTINTGHSEHGGGDKFIAAVVPQGRLGVKFDDAKQAARGSTAADTAQMVRDFHHGPAAAAQVQ